MMDIVQFQNHCKQFTQRAKQATVTFNPIDRLVIIADQNCHVVTFSLNHVLDIEYTGPVYRSRSWIEYLESRDLFDRVNQQALQDYLSKKTYSTIVIKLYDQQDINLVVHSMVLVNLISLLNVSVTDILFNPNEKFINTVPMEVDRDLFHFQSDLQFDFIDYSQPIVYLA